VKINASAAELLEGYEALRAQALGELPRFGPRGLAVFMQGGLVAWMRAYPPQSRLQSPSPAPICRRSGTLSARSPDLVCLLAQMALAIQRRRCPA